MAVRQPFDLEREVVEGFEHAALVTEYLIGALPRRLWHAAPPGGEGRSLAAIAAHMQSLRRTFAHMGGSEPLPSLDKNSSTPAEARRAFRQSREALTTLFREAIAAGKPRVKKMPRRTINMMMYLIQHEAHHRGQMAMLARELGHKLSQDDIMRMWGWKRLADKKA